MKLYRLLAFVGALAITLLLASLTSDMLSGARAAPESSSRAAP